MRCANKSCDLEKNVENREMSQKKEDKQEKCEDLRKVVEDVVGFGDGEFLTDLSLTLVNSLKTLASEHVNRLCRKICLKQTVYKKMRIPSIMMELDFVFF